MGLVDCFDAKTCKTEPDPEFAASRRANDELLATLKPLLHIANLKPCSCNFVQ